MDVPDHIPSGLTVAEGYRQVSEGLAIAAAQYPEDELRQFVIRLAGDLQSLADEIDPSHNEQH